MQTRQEFDQCWTPIANLSFHLEAGSSSSQMASLSSCTLKPVLSKFNWPLLLKISLGYQEWSFMDIPTTIHKE